MTVNPRIPLEKMAPFRWESIGAHMVVLIAARL